MSSIKRMSGLEISLAVSEIHQQLVGLRVLNVYSINKRTYLIKLSGTNQFYPSTTKQYLLIESGVRLHLTEFERELDATPNGLATAIRRQLKGKTLASIDQSGLDRVVKLTFGIGVTAMNLFIELFGTGNIVFCDNELNIVALLRQQAYGAALLGAAPIPNQPSTDQPSAGLNQTAPANAVTLRSKYQWQSAQSNTSAPSDSFPPQIDADFVLALIQNKHNRLLQQQREQEAQPAPTAPAPNGKKAPRARTKPTQTTIKQVLYESMLGPQLCLHGCTQLGLDLNQSYVNVLTDKVLLGKLVQALQLGTEFYKQMIADRAGYLHCRLTSVVTQDEDKKGPMALKCDENVVTVDFSPGNLAQTTISPTVYSVPTVAAPATPEGETEKNAQTTKSQQSVQDGTIINSNDAINSKLDVLLTTTTCSNKISAEESVTVDKTGAKVSTPLFKTFNLPENGYQTFNWGLITPTSVTRVVSEGDNKKKSQVVVTTTIKDVWFYSPKFSLCVDTYYGTKEVEKEAQRMGREKINVLNKIEKTKMEQFSRLKVLKDNIDIMLLKAQLIENNQTWVQQSINAVQQQLNRGLDWFLVADLIKQQKGLLNPLALLIDKLEFAASSMTVSLSWELEHISVLIQNEVIKRNAELVKRQQEHIIPGSHVPARNAQQYEDSDSDYSDDEDEDEDDDEDNEDEDDEDDDNDDLIVDDLDDEEGVKEARADQEDLKSKENAMGSWKKPIKITIDFTQTAFANAQIYYSHVKELTRKHQVAEQFASEQIKSIEKKGQKELHQVKEIQAKQRRKVLWFEKFYWFISSENFLVVGGRDATQNELLVKRYLDTNDFYFHADMHGASSVVVKVPSTYVQQFQKEFPGKPLVLPQQTLYEVAGFTTCHSNAWVNKTNNTRAYWVYSDQVSKTPPTGMYLEKGSFIIRGKKNYIEPQPLQMGVGLLFRCGDDESIANHVGERQVRSMGAGAVEEGQSGGSGSGIGSEKSEKSGKKTSAFELEQNRAQERQEDLIAQLEKEEQERVQKQLQIKSLREQKSGTGTTGSAENDSALKNDQNGQNSQKIAIVSKKILSKNDRYQMKKLGMTDPAAYWQWKEAQDAAKKNPVKSELLDGTEDGPEDGDDFDQNGQVPDWLKKSKAEMGGSDEESEEGEDGDNDNDDDDDEDDEQSIEIESDVDGEEDGDDFDADGKVPDWLQKTKAKFGGSDDDDDDDDEDEDDDDDDENQKQNQSQDIESGDDVDSDGEVPDWLNKTKAKFGGSDIESDDDDDDDDQDDDEPVPTSTKPAHLRAQQVQNNPKQGGKGGQKQKQPAGKGKGATPVVPVKPDPKPAPKQTTNTNSNSKSKSKSKKGNKSKGFESDGDDDEGAFDPLKFLPKSKKHLLNAFDLSSDDDDSKKKKHQHGENRKKGNTKDARAARQEALRLAEEETKALKAKQAEERNKQYLAKVAAKKQAKKESIEIAQSMDPDGATVPVDDDDDDDEFNDLSNQRHQQQRAEVEGTELILSTLTTKPTPSDYITHAIPVVAPLSALMDYPFKVKLVPGGQKKGQTIKDSNHVFLQTIQSLYKHPPLSTQMSAKKAQALASGTNQIVPLDHLPEEQQVLIQKEKQFQALLTSLLKQVSDNEFSLVMISNAKVSVQGIQQVHKQQKMQKKQSAKQKEKNKN